MAEWDHKKRDFESSSARSKNACIVIYAWNSTKNVITTPGAQFRLHIRIRKGPKGWGGFYVEAGKRRDHPFSDLPILVMSATSGHF